MFFLRIVLLLLILSGVTLIFDARILTAHWFGFGDQNEATTGMKILGFIIAILGAIILYKLM